MSDPIYAVSKEGSTERLSMMDLWQQKIANYGSSGGNIQKPASDLSASEKAAKMKEDIRAGRIECPTCASRRYVDQSDDPSVSFQTPQKISPGQTRSLVASHEREHVVNENARAKKENREVVSSTVTLSYAKCPECGVSYVSGGLTSTATKSKVNPEKTEQAKSTVDYKV